jgi:hypothetical protein
VTDLADLDRSISAVRAELAVTEALLAREVRKRAKSALRPHTRTRARPATTLVTQRSARGIGH